MDLIEIDAASNTSVDDVRDLRDKIGEAVDRRLGVQNPEMRRIVREEIAAALAGSDRQPEPQPAAPEQPVGSRHERLVVNATGRNATGVLASICNAIGEFSGDIRDVSQTIVGDYFHLMEGPAVRMRPISIFGARSKFSRGS
jgi:hypothetical protein